MHDEVEGALDEITDVIVDGVVALEVVVVTDDPEARAARGESAVFIGGVACDAATGVHDDAIAEILVGSVVDHGAAHGDVDSIAAVEGGNAVGHGRMVVELDAAQGAAGHNPTVCHIL